MIQSDIIGIITVYGALPSKRKQSGFWHAPPFLITWFVSCTFSLCCVSYNLYILPLYLSRTSS